jgi:hypothetical protein
MSSMSNQEALKIQAYLQQKFSNPGFTVRARAQTTDSIEVLLNNEFIGVVYKDDEDSDDVSYDFNMAILEMDLPA